MLAKFFIERPVLANVIAFVMMLLGAVALGVLPVSQYPPITPPTVQVTTTYPGASARTLVETVALPIEQQVNGVEKMLYMQSNSTSDGRYTLTALATQISAGGQALDGNGDGTGGDNYVFSPQTNQGLFRLYGDANGDRRVDNLDFFQLRSTFGHNSGDPLYLAFLDVNGDGRVDNADFFLFRNRFGTTLNP